MKKKKFLLIPVTEKNSTYTHIFRGISLISTVMVDSGSSRTSPETLVILLTSSLFFYLRDLVAVYLENRHFITKIIFSPCLYKSLSYV